MAYLAKIIVTYCKNIANPNSESKLEQVRHEGYGIERLVAGKYFELTSTSKTKKQALAEAIKICEQVLANPVYENYRIVSVDKLVE